jgi:hypothetical protein
VACFEGLGSIFRVRRENSGLEIGRVHYCFASRGNGSSYEVKWGMGEWGRWVKWEAEEFLVTGCQFLVTQNQKLKTENSSEWEAEEFLGAGCQFLVTKN